MAAATNQCYYCGKKAKPGKKWGRGTDYCGIKRRFCSKACNGKRRALEEEFAGFRGNGRVFYTTEPIANVAKFVPNASEHTLDNCHPPSELLVENENRWKVYCSKPVPSFRLEPVREALWVMPEEIEGQEKSHAAENIADEPIWAAEEIAVEVSDREFAAKLQALEI